MSLINIDEDVASALAPVLSALRHDVRHARMTPGMAGITDAQQLLIAAKRGAAYVSHNVKDFRLLHVAWLRWARAWSTQQVHGGILLVPQGLAVAMIGAAIHRLLETEPRLTNSCFEWQPGRGWRPSAVRS